MVQRIASSVRYRVEVEERQPIAHTEEERAQVREWATAIHRGPNYRRHVANIGIDEHWVLEEYVRDKIRDCRTKCGLKNCGLTIALGGLPRLGQGILSLTCPLMEFETKAEAQAAEENCRAAQSATASAVTDYISESADAIKTAQERIPAARAEIAEQQRVLHKLL
jgi:hypothetical protein